MATKRSTTGRKNARKTGAKKSKSKRPPKLSTKQVEAKVRKLAREGKITMEHSSRQEKYEAIYNRFVDHVLQFRALFASEEAYMSNFRNSPKWNKRSPERVVWQNRTVFEFGVDIQDKMDEPFWDIIEYIATHPNLDKHNRVT